MTPIDNSHTHTHTHTKGWGGGWGLEREKQMAKKQMKKLISIIIEEIQVKIVK